MIDRLEASTALPAVELVDRWEALEGASDDLVCVVAAEMPMGLVSPAVVELLAERHERLAAVYRRLAAGG